MDMSEDTTRLPWVDQIAAAFPTHGFEAFHRETLPDLVARHGHLVAKDLAGAPPIAFRRREDGLTFTWRATPAGVEVIEGDAGAATLVEIGEQAFSDYVNELVTAVGADRTRRARYLRGDIWSWRRWEPAIRSLCDGRPIYGPEARETLVDEAGRPLAFDHVFAPDAPMEEMRRYLEVMGYLHVRAVFSPDEIARIGAEVERCRAGSRPGDPRSWWSTNAEGQELVTRINHCERFSPALLELAHDARLTRFGRLAGRHMRVCDDRLDGPMVFIKNPGLVKGNGDLMWHIDDGVGGRPVMNPLIQAGIQLDPANADNGQVLLMPGSHRYNKHAPERGDEGDLPVLALDTEPGDLTLHFGDTMHCTPPPRSPEAGRRVLYYKFAEPKTFAWIPPQRHYNDVLFTVDDSGQVAARGSSWDGSAY